VDLVAILEPTTPRSRAPIVHWGGVMLAPWINQQLAFIDSVLVGLENLSGQRRDRYGPTLKIFRRNAPDGPRGRPYAFASSFVTDHSPAHAFDLAGSQWVANGRGEAARQQFVGYDFGGEGVASGDVVEIQWITPTATPRQFAIETSTGDGGWTEVGRFDVSYSAGDPNFRTDQFALGRIVSARKWRIVALAVAENHGFGVTEVRIGSTRR
jgi:hypothetical protein